MHPKRKASRLDGAERKRAARAVREVLSERFRLGGKEAFVDLYGMPGRYRSPLAGRTCPECGGALARVAIGGGPCIYCPACQIGRGPPRPDARQHSDPRAAGCPADSQPEA